MQVLAEAAVALQTELVTTAEALEALRPEWSALWDRCPDATPFQTPEWLLPWWQRFGDQPGWKLWTWALRAEGKLVGLAPLFIKPLGGSTDRQVIPIGIGITDYLDVLLEPGIAAEGAERLLHDLAEHRDHWDMCDLQGLRPESALLTAPIPCGVAAEVRQPEVCPVLPLPGSWEDLLNGRSAWLRRNIRQGHRRLSKTGDLRFGTADVDTLSEYLDALFRLHEQRWQLKGDAGALHGPEIQDYHREVAADLLARGLLRMHGMRLDGQLVAVWYGLAARQRVYAYQSGFEPGLARSSPGTLIIGRAIEEAIREGAREFDFLRGSESYKYDWGAEDRPACWLQLRPVS